ncbi:biopolymer transporter ExbD [Pedobacter aquatilis]|uniref:ExbD/TolR family protein n=1 Tax=Pedobacter aquatilis TaxID=351343 RepID=UPI0025B5183E|nr:biopolymer transporter ExbD [Pedobacter aquatilis]MDN3586489.1 biopolymer transporter ExbD [Pedobacter aquatilis]
MLTTSLSELQAADVSKPIPSKISEPYPASRTMTILLGNNNKAAYYLGETDKANLKVEKVSAIGNVITTIKKDIAKLHKNNPNKFMIVIIKPTQKSRYKDLIDVIDELKILGIKSYSIDDENTTKEETEFITTIIFRT